MNLKRSVRSAMGTSNWAHLVWERWCHTQNREKHQLTSKSLQQSHAITHLRTPLLPVPSPSSYSSAVSQSSNIQTPLLNILATDLDVKRSLHLQMVTHTVVMEMYLLASTECRTFIWTDHDPPYTTICFRSKLVLLMSCTIPVPCPSSSLMGMYEQKWCKMEYNKSDSGSVSGVASRHCLS